MNTFLYGSAQRSRSSLRGFTLLELIIVMSIGGFITMLIIGLLLKAREKSRQELCSDNLRQIIRGVRAYEETNGRFPPGRLKPDWTRNGFPLSGYTNYESVQQTANEKTGFYSVHVWILPHVNAQKTYDKIDFTRAQAKRMLDSQDQPHNINYAPYTQPMPQYLCPADPNTSAQGITENNYRYNFGGSTPGAGARNLPNVYEPRPTDLYHPGGNGAFTIGELGLESSAYTDGLSKTVFFSERSKGDNSDPTVSLSNTTAIIRSASAGAPSVPVDIMLQGCASTVPALSQFVFTTAGRFPPNSQWANGWPFAGYDSTEYNHLAPPNWEKIDCGLSSFVPDTPVEMAIIAARSQHAGGVNVAYGDGRVKFIKNEIALIPWRAFGTRNGEEMLQQQTQQTQQSQKQGSQSQ